MNNKNIYFHVGLAKTGSTFLQNNFFPKLQNIKYISTHKYRRCIDIINNTNYDSYLISREFDRQLEGEVKKILNYFPETKIIIAFREHKKWFNYFYDKEWDYLYPLLEESTDYFVETLGIKTPRIRSSKMSVKGNKSKYILNICLEIGATTYLSGPFGRDYLKLDEFKREGIRVVFHRYDNPNYKQLIKEFQNNMSVVDLIFNEGPKSFQIISGELSK